MRYKSGAEPELIFDKGIDILPKILFNRSAFSAVPGKNNGSRKIINVLCKGVSLICQYDSLILIRGINKM
jgi:hypothetical protein